MTPPENKVAHDAGMSTDFYSCQRPITDYNRRVPRGFAERSVATTIRFPRGVATGTRPRM